MVPADHEPEQLRTLTSFHTLVSAVRLILGLEFFLNGLNWWIKIIGPYPSISDYAGGQPVHAGLVGAMIATGFLFHVVKAVELLAGIALLTNRWVPLALVSVFSVTLNVFFVDVLISTHLRAHIMGTGAMLMSIFLMFSYLPYYLPMLAKNAQAHMIVIPGQSHFMPSGWVKACFTGLGLVSLGFGVVMIGWVAVMIFQTFSG
jgi:uncharacterized membrane protein